MGERMSQALFPLPSLFPACLAMVLVSPARLTTLSFHSIPLPTSLPSFLPSSYFISPSSFIRVKVGTETRGRLVCT